MNESSDNWPQGQPVEPKPRQAAPARKAAASPNAAAAPNVPAGRTAATTTAAANTKAGISPQRLISGLSQQIQPVVPTSGYRLGVACVALVLMLLPAMIVGLAGMLAVGLWFSLASGNLLGMLFCGTLLFLLAFFGISLLKPMFARSGDYHPPIELKREHEPVLFAFVERLCDVVGAPMPVVIQVDTDVNASASYRGLFGMLFGNELVLSIGLPLVAGLPLRQVTGVIAHELGHFTQGSAMRLSNLVRRISVWFQIAAFSRDSWDDRLAAMAHTGGAMSLIARAMQFGVFVSRYGLYFLCKFIHMLSCRLTREMEFGADLYEMRVVGKETFCRTSMNLHALGHGFAEAQQDLMQSWRDHRLSDDLAAMVVAKVNQMRADPKTAAKVKQSVMEEKTEWFMTHPSTPERIAAAQRENAPGVFHVDAPSTVLFHDFPGLCKMVTLHFYHEVIGPEVTPKNLVATETIVGEQRALDEAFETLNRYFQGKVLGTHELFLPKEKLYTPQNPKQTAKSLGHFRQRMVDHLMETVQKSRRYEVADERVHELRMLQIILNAGFLFNPAEYRLPEPTPFAVQNALTQAERERQHSRQMFQESLKDAQNRLVAALQLLHVPQVAQRIPKAAEIQARCRTLLTTQVALEEVWPMVTDLTEVGRALAILLDIVQSTEVDYQLYQQVMAVKSDTLQRIQWIRGQLATKPYPFDHARGKVSIADYALHNVPLEDELGQVLDAAIELPDNLYNLYYRMIAHLASMAESVETAFGYEPLPKPPEQSSENWWEADITTDAS